jgi:multisubunit Na+/H+ antiporter MnhE subunit
MSKNRKLAAMIAIAMPVFYLFWLIFVGSFSAHELEIGIIAAVLAVAGTTIIEVQYPSCFAPNVGELLAVWRLPWYLITGTWQIWKVAMLDVLGTPAKSLFRLVPFDAGDKDDERAVARRVLAVAYTTMTPNSVVLGINTNCQEMLVHEFEPNPVSKMMRRLGAEG